jgi:hypothetical protein
VSTTLKCYVKIHVLAALIGCFPVNFCHEDASRSWVFEPEVCQDMEKPIEGAAEMAGLMVLEA